MDWTASSVRGGLQLVFDGVGGIAGIVEGMHETIARRPLPWAPDPSPPSRAHGIVAAAVYAGIRGGNDLLRGGVDRMFEIASPSSSDSREGESPGHATFLGIVNGLVGDHLERTDNPLAVQMHFRGRRHWIPLHRGPRAVEAEIEAVSPHLVVLIHGLCMSERGWSRNGDHRLADAIAGGGESTPVYLRYNSGRRVSINGRELALRLDDLVEAWPVAVETVTLVGHSMGGLLARSAAYYGEEDGRRWRSRLRRIVCLGSPHHGTPLERGGHALHRALAWTPYARPLALGHLRSEGIRDLGYGNLRDEDWRDERPTSLRTDRRLPVPLAADVSHYFAAGAATGEFRGAGDRLFGDLLVPVASALGAHPDRRRDLRAGLAGSRIFRQLDHMALLDDPAVIDQVAAWNADSESAASRRLSRRAGALPEGCR